MFVQITKEEFLKELSKKTWYQTNIIVYSVVFIYPLFSILDLIFADTIWVQFLIVRIIIDLVILGLHSMFQRKNYDYRLLLHITFFLISTTSAVLCSVVDIQQLNIYFLIYATVILFFNLQVFWEPVNSIIQVAIAFLMTAIFFDILSQYTLDLIVGNGGQFFFIIALISCLVPRCPLQSDGAGCAFTNTHR